MSMFEKLTVGQLVVRNGSGINTLDPSIVSGTAATRAQIRAEGGDDLNVGSIYIADDRIYQKIANTAADADWYKVTATNAD